MKCLVELEIDKDKLIKAAETDDINQALMNEMGWVEQSGIYLTKIIEKNKK